MRTMEEYTCKGCVHKLELHKHPSNSNVFKGSIDEPTGLFACLLFHHIENSVGILFDKDAGCEMYSKRKQSD